MVKRLVLLFILDILILVGGLVIALSSIIIMDSFNIIAGILIILCGIGQVLEYAIDFYDKLNKWYVRSGIISITFGVFIIYNSISELIVGKELCYISCIWMIISGALSMLGDIGFGLGRSQLWMLPLSGVGAASSLLSEIVIILGVACIITPLSSTISIDCVLGMCMFSFGVKSLMIWSQAMCLLKK